MMRCQISKIDWFGSVAQSLPRLTISLEISQMVYTWDEAVAQCSHPSWEATTLNASNALSLHLNSVCKQEYQCWNKVVESAKATISPGFKYVEDYVAERKLDKVVAECVE